MKRYHEPFLGGGAVATRYLGNDELRPLTKWAGGKRWLLDRHGGLLPDAARDPCVLNDSNTRLKGMLRAVQRDPLGVVHELNALRPDVLDQERYYRIRESFNTLGSLEDSTLGAAWFLFLNRTCFNGLYRENKSGKFNVPFGRYKTVNLPDDATILSWSEALAGSTLLAIDFRDALDYVAPGDFVYLDPPFVPRTDQEASFTQYGAAGVGPKEQEALAERLVRLDCLGATFVLSNDIAARDLYEGRGFAIYQANVVRAINSKGDGRGATAEILVTNQKGLDDDALHASDLEPLHARCGAGHARRSADAGAAQPGAAPGGASRTRAGHRGSAGPVEGSGPKRSRPVARSGADEASGKALARRVSDRAARGRA